MQRVLMDEHPPTPRGLRPMLATLGEMPRSEERYAYEFKWDGVRALAHCSPPVGARAGTLHLASRNGQDLTRLFPELSALPEALDAPTVLDGEVVAFDKQGNPDFVTIQPRLNLTNDRDVAARARSIPASFMIFDVLWRNGESLLGRGYDERREVLEGLGLAGDHWTTPGAYDASGQAVLAASQERGLEGVVAKQRDSPYEAGVRSRNWIKLKNRRRQELVVGGWTPGKGARQGTIGALLVGYHDEAGDLVYVGRVGSGLDERMLAALAKVLLASAAGSSPFARGQPPQESRFVSPRLVAEVAFHGWTPDGSLRHPVFLGLRTDIDPKDVVREVT